MLQPACQKDSITIEPIGKSASQATADGMRCSFSSTMLKKPVSRSRKIRKIQPTATSGIM